jgi:hypothetical protein
VGEKLDCWIAASGTTDFVRIKGKLNADKYIKFRIKFIQDKSSIHEANVIKHWFV